MEHRDLRALIAREPSALCGIAAAVIGSAVVGVGGTLYATGQASKAADKASQAQQQAADASIAEQRRQFDFIQQQNEPWRQLGLSAGQALASGYGLPVSMTGSAPAPSASPSPGGSMTGGSTSSGQVYAPGDASWLNNAPSGGMNLAPGGYAPNTAPSMTASQGDAILRDRPDVANNEWLASVDPSVIGDRTGDGQVTAQDRALYWQANYGGGYTPPSTQTPAPAAPSTTTPPGYTDPTAPSGYTMTPRPTIAPLDVSLGAYQQSPDFQFQMTEGQKALDHVASTSGGLMSGARLKAATRYAQDYATTDYSNWRGYATGQYNTDRARSDGLYQDDRSNLNSRYDTRNGQLMQLAGFGTSATGSNAGAAQSYASNVGSSLMTAGNAQANGYINSANAVSSGVNNLMTSGTYLAGRYMGGGGSTGFGGGVNYSALGGQTFSPSTSYNFGGY